MSDYFVHTLKFGLIQSLALRLESKFAQVIGHEAGLWSSGFLGAIESLLYFRFSSCPYITPIPTWSSSPFHTTAALLDHGYTV
ncbi:hypothetical protein M405DRAFT_485237 [Rhizopogon salebrosus TDB-379]|nr:hypothetical protein M405DRAFT_485237 [Rhizopogon salebrosus TDB-379]